MMDNWHHRETWKIKCIPCIFLLLTLVSPIHCMVDRNNTQQPLSCKDDEYPTKSGICCNKCSPGYKLVEDCKGEGMRSTCEKCRPGTYQSVINYYRNCFRCKSCDKSNAYVKTNCTHDQDTQCQCEDGFYMKYIDAFTWSCKSCKPCKDGEREVKKCGGEQNRECECKDGYFRKAKTCIQCTNCSSDCSYLCPTGGPPKVPSTKGPLEGPVIPQAVIALLFVISGLIGGASLYKLVSKWRKRSQKQSSQSPESPDQEKMIIKFPTYTCQVVKEENESIPLSHQQPCLSSVLPDCVPREIKTHEFIYFVLNQIPVSRFKELVRRLNVSEQDIDRAERDNRAFADAQYQMMKVWIDSCTGGGSTVLPPPLLQECMDRLKDMNLISCVDRIEETYCTDT